MINYSIYIACKKPGTKKADYNTVGTMAYGSAQMNEKLSFDQFCKHIADHNSPFSKGTIASSSSAATGFSWATSAPSAWNWPALPPRRLTTSTPTTSRL